MTTTDATLIFIAQLLFVLCSVGAMLYILEKAVEAVQSKILINQLKRTPYIKANVLNNTESKDDYRT